MIKSLGTALALLTALAGLPQTAQAANIHTIGPGQTVQINKHGHCRRVTNLSFNSVAIPTRSANEWVNGATSFLGRGNEILGFNLTACPTFTYGKILAVNCYVAQGGSWHSDKRYFEICSRPGLEHFTGTRTDEQAFGFELSHRPDQAHLMGNPSVHYTQRVSSFNSSCIIGFQPVINNAFNNYFGLDVGQWQGGSPFNWDYGGRKSAWAREAAKGYELDHSWTKGMYKPGKNAAGITHARNISNIGGFSHTWYQRSVCAPHSVDLPRPQPMIKTKVTEWETYKRMPVYRVSGISKTVGLNVRAFTHDEWRAGHAAGYQQDVAYYRINGGAWRKPSVDEFAFDAYVKNGDTIEISARILWPDKHHLHMTHRRYLAFTRVGLEFTGLSGADAGYVSTAEYMLEHTRGTSSAPRKFVAKKSGIGLYYEKPGIDEQRWENGHISNSEYNSERLDKSP